jgi:hypothetical protein
MALVDYHAGQLAVQEEANTRPVATKLLGWSGPIAEFVRGADLLLFAAPGSCGSLLFSAVSGPAPLVEIEEGAPLRLRFAGAAPALEDGARCGGLAISMAYARRARINGRVSGGVLEAEETFTLCRKYIAPSLCAGDAPRAGPVAREPVALEESWVAALVGSAQTAYLATQAPNGLPDVAHRGGMPGFLRFDAAARSLAWTEYVGDGVFKSVGNLRATRRMTLLVPCPETGDAVELIGSGDYRNIRTERKQRVDPLLQEREPYPVQGEIRAELSAAYRLRGFAHPRRAIAKALRVTSHSAVSEQQPQ